MLVPGWPQYQVSDLGRVRGYRGRLLKGLELGDGYRGIILCGEHGQQRRYIHELVLTTFAGERPTGHYACHNNGVRDDNRLANLRWDTPRSNNLDQILHGTNFETRKTHCPRGHELTPPNLVVAELGRGHRKCRACNQARAFAQRHNMPLSVADANVRYLRIMEGAA